MQNYMAKQRDLELILRSRVPIVVIETREESRMLDLLKAIAISRATEDYMPLFRWTITDGLQRLDISLEPQLHNADPSGVLQHIRAVRKPGIYVLLDFHPYLEDPVNVRLLKNICIRFTKIPRQLILVSHKVRLPRELESFSARFELDLPTEKDRKKNCKTGRQRICGRASRAAGQGRSKGIRTADSESRWIAGAGYRATGS